MPFSSPAPRKQASKIGKVMRKIQALDAIPRDEDFHFKERAKKLMDKVRPARLCSLALAPAGELRR